MASSVLVAILHSHSLVVRVMLLQMILYVFVVGSLYVILHLRYRQPFWRALGMRYPDKFAWVCAFAGRRSGGRARA